jgi:isopentenyl diphosphate isomerase/L-lactate dehydrogenase-like FMN-dependent dehydrogenase
MSRSSPTGFGFSILLEIAAVVAIVAFLPRIDLRPSNVPESDPVNVQASRIDAQAADAAISPVGWTALDIRNGEATRATSYYEQATPKLASAPATGSFSTPAAPPLIDTYRPDPKYVEDRLDRASQQLVNSAGSAVSNASSNWLPPQKLQPPTPTTVQRPRTGPTTSTQPRPWLRY